MLQKSMLFFYILVGRLGAGTSQQASISNRQKIQNQNGVDVARDPEQCSYYIMMEVRGWSKQKKIPES